MLRLLFVELPVGEFDEFDVETMCALSDVLAVAALLRSNVRCMIGTRQFFYGPFAGFRLAGSDTCYLLPDTTLPSWCTLAMCKYGACASIYFFVFVFPCFCISLVLCVFVVYLCSSRVLKLN